jgi:hypothetical protein
MTSFDSSDLSISYSAAGEPVRIISSQGDCVFSRKVGPNGSVTYSFRPIDADPGAAVLSNFECTGSVIPTDGQTPTDSGNQGSVKAYSVATTSDAKIVYTEITLPDAERVVDWMWILRQNDLENSAFQAARRDREITLRALADLQEVFIQAQQKLALIRTRSCQSSTPPYVQDIEKLLKSLGQHVNQEWDWVRRDYIDNSGQCDQRTQGACFIVAAILAIAIRENALIPCVPYGCLSRKEYERDLLEAI